MTGARRGSGRSPAAQARSVRRRLWLVAGPLVGLAAGGASMVAPGQALGVAVGGLVGTSWLHLKAGAVARALEVEPRSPEPGEPGPSARRKVRAFRAKTLLTLPGLVLALAGAVWYTPVRLEGVAAGLLIALAALVAALATEPGADGTDPRPPAAP